MVTSESVRYNSWGIGWRIQPGNRCLELVLSCVFSFMGHLYFGVILYSYLMISGSTQYSSWDIIGWRIQPGSRYLELAFSCVFFFMGHLYVGVIETCCRYPPQSVGVQEIACHMGLELGRYMFNYKTFKRMRMSWNIGVGWTTSCCNYNL